MWFHLFSEETGGVRVPDLKNHIRQNHDIPKLIYTEEYLPPHQRLNWFYRIIRFVLGVLMMQLMAVAVFNGIEGEEAYGYCQRRIECLAYCQRDTYPNLQCGVVDGLKIEYNENEYTDLFHYPYDESDDFETCHDYVEDNEDYPFSTLDTDRQWKVHTCFKDCKDLTADDVADYQRDDRPECGSGSDANTGLYCVSPDEDCETIHVEDEECISGKDTCFSMTIVWIAILMANAGQLIFEIALLYTKNVTRDPTSLELLIDPQKEQKITAEDEEEISCDKTLKKCGGETIIFITWAAALLILIISFLGAEKYGRLNTIFLEFMFVFIFDQVKSLLVQPILWFVFVRRCGRISGGFEIWADEHVMLGVKDESFLDELRRRVGALLESKPIFFSMFGLVGFYAVFILAWLALDPYLEDNQDAQDFFYYTDFSLLCVFIVEILLSVFAWWMTFLCELLSFIDTLVVIVSFILAAMRASVKGIAVLRLLRLVRVVIAMKKVGEKKKRLAALRRKEMPVSTNVTKVLEILEGLTESKAIPRNLKLDLAWVTELISSRKIYTASIELDHFEDVSEDVKMWKREISNYEEEQLMLRQSNVMRDEKKRSERRTQSQIDIRMPASHNELENRIDDLLGITPEEMEALAERMDDIDEWNWDVNEFVNTTGEQAFSILGLKLMLYHDVFKYQNFDINICANFFNKLQEGYYESNKFHNVNHIIDCVHAMHFFFRPAGIEIYLAQSDIPIGFIAAFIHDFEHPGVTNQFLVRVKHPIAIRYSDKAPLENHHVAAAFNLMNDSDLNIFSFMSQDQFLVTRKIMIDLILSTEFSNHFELYSNLQASIQREEFPQETLEDRLILLKMTLHCADMFKFTKEVRVFLSWLEKMSEEFFAQGEMEKQLGFQVTPFMDKDNTIKEVFAKTYLDIIVRPTIELMNILSPESSKDVIKEKLVSKGIDQNLKNLQKKLDES